VTVTSDEQSVTHIATTVAEMTGATITDEKIPRVAIIMKTATASTSRDTEGMTASSADRHGKAGAHQLGTVRTELYILCPGKPVSLTEIHAMGLSCSHYDVILHWIGAQEDGILDRSS
jgi:hypothetical protein